MKLPLLAAGSLIALATACVHAPASPAVEDKAPLRVVVTGSRIPRPIDPATGLPSTISPTRIYRRDQLDSTGRTYDPAAALRALDPSLTY
jgi:hypothetical protein